MYKAGDKITITQEMVDRLNQKLSVNLYSSWLGKTGVFFISRVTRSDVLMCIDWGDNEKTNTWWLREAGIEYEEPKCEVLPIMECEDDLLSTEEIVIRNLMRKGYSESEATSKIKEIAEAMAENGIVFYIP